MTLGQDRRDRLPDPGAGFVWDAVEGTETWVLRPEGRTHAAFTTRPGGVSTGPLASLNLSPRVEAQHGGPGEHVTRNRRVAAKAIGRDERWTTVRQVHGSRVVSATSAQDGPVDADAVWTDDRGPTLAVLVADCVPVLLEGAGRLACAHAGWRGLVDGVVEAAADAVGAVEVLAGPAIGPCCYEVGDEVRSAFIRRFGSDVVSSRHVDLWAATEVAAVRAGAERVRVTRLCTSCHPDLFYSHRRDAGVTGRQALIARLGDA